MKNSSDASRWWDWSAVALLFVLLQVLASRLVSTSWTPYLYQTQVFASQGVVIGLILGYSRFQRRSARWLSFLYMLLLLPLQWTSIIDQRVSLEEQFASVWGRLSFSVTELIAQRPVEDPIFFVAIMSIVFWIISASAGYSLTRHQNYLRAVIPSAIGMLVIQQYDLPGRVWVLAFYTFIALLLLGRLNFLQNKASWQTRRVFFSTENSIDLAGGMAILAGLIILTSFIVPASRAGVESAMKTWERVTQPWNDFTDNLENAISAIDSPSGGKPGEFYGSELPLGRGFPLSDAVMFQVTIPNLPEDEKPPRYYWRGRTYDFFLGGQWYTTGTTREKFSPRDDVPSVIDTEERNPQTFTFDIGESRFSLLYAPSQPVWFSRPGSFLAAPAESNKDIISWNADPSLLPGETYEAQVVLKDPNIQQLREAGTDYPKWVTDKYLQLPEGFSPRIVDLAKEITANADTPYDQAQAITFYLRDNITYTQTIPAPPRNQDPLEWILFEHKQAYCVYYATSEVLMLRSLGIPARMAVGFSEGILATRGDISENDRIETYTILKKNAHAWPEVYFSGIGWVEFEPTSNQDLLTRPLPPSDSLNDNNSLNSGLDPLAEDGADFAGREAPDEEGVVQTQPQDTTVTPSLYLISLLIALAALTVFLGIRYNIPMRAPVLIRASFERSGAKVPMWIIRWESWTTLSPIEKAFQSINFGLRILKQPLPIHSTPIERANALTRALPHIAEPIKLLLDEHQTYLYTSRTADVSKARRSALVIRLQVIIARIRHFWTGTYAIHS
jgi:transglutaminase-like putative cysteine protease